MDDLPTCPSNTSFLARITILHRFNVTDTSAIIVLCCALKTTPLDNTMFTAMNFLLDYPRANAQLEFNLQLLQFKQSQAVDSMFF